MNDATPVAAPSSDAADIHKQFLEGMRRVAHTVSIVTTDGPAGRAGATVSAMTSVSVDTPLPTLLVCLNASGHTGPAVLANGTFAVNVLAADQTPVSDAFAGRNPAGHGDRFDDLATRPGQLGAPILVDALATFDCRVVSSNQVGTHHVIIGEVMAMHFTPDRPALVYLNRSYGRFLPIPKP